MREIVEHSFTEKQETAWALISQFLDLKDQLNLRKVSRTTRKLIDSTAFSVKSVRITLFPNYTFINYDEHEIRYDVESIEEVYYDLIEDLKVIFENRNNKFEKLFIDFDPRAKRRKQRQMDTNGRLFYRDFAAILNSFDHKQHVEKLSLQVDSLSDFKQVLGCLQPQILSEIELVNVDFPLLRKPEWITMQSEEQQEEEKRLLYKKWEETDSEFQDDISRMEQFLKAKIVAWNHRPLWIPINRFFRFNRFEIQIPHKVMATDLNDLKKSIFGNAELRDSFKKCSLLMPHHLDVEEAPKILDLFQRENEPDEYSWHLRIPESKDRLVWFLGDSTVFVQRVSMNDKPRQARHNLTKKRKKKE